MILAQSLSIDVMTNITDLGFSYLTEVGARGLLNMGKKLLDHQIWENLMQSKRMGLQF